MFDAASGGKLWRHLGLDGMASTDRGEVGIAMLLIVCFDGRGCRLEESGSSRKTEVVGGGWIGGYLLPELKATSHSWIGQACGRSPLGELLDG